MAVQTENRARQGQQLQQQLKGAARKAYAEQQNPALQNKRVVEYLPMVSVIAERVTSYLKPPLSMEDLVSAGAIALVKAARDYDTGRDAEFKTYAYIRVKGAIIDELRAWSFVPGGVVKQFQHMQKVMRGLMDQTGTFPSDAELAEALEITVDELYKRLELGRGQHFLSIHGPGQDGPVLGDALADGAVSDPGRSLEQAELLEHLTEAIQRLPDRQRRIIVLYYNQHLTMKQIAKVLGITESRVSQLHASAIFKLSVELRKYNESGE